MTTRHLITATLLACGLGCSLGAAAQAMKPGLWELSSKISSSDPQVQAGVAGLQQHLANMTPEQRQQMERMMRQNGIQLDVGPTGAVRTKMCMTKEMIERKELPVQEGDCSQKVTQQSATRMAVSFSCTRPAVQGDGEITVLSDTSYRARMNVKSAQFGNDSVDTEVTGKWLSASCGNLRPIPIPRAK